MISTFLARKEFQIFEVVEKWNTIVPMFYGV
jgi:hypothetical protein